MQKRRCKCFSDNSFTTPFNLFYKVITQLQSCCRIKPAIRPDGRLILQLQLITTITLLQEAEKACRGM